MSNQSNSASNATDKADDAFRTISEVSELLDVPPHVLRFWETKFHQVKPMKRGGGRRYYRPADVDLIAGIKTLLQDEGLTVKGVQKVLKDQGVAHVVSWGQRRREDDVAVVSKPAAPKRRTPQLGKAERKVLKSALDELQKAKSAISKLQRH